MGNFSANNLEIRESVRFMAEIIASDPAWNIYDHPDLELGSTGAFNEAAYNVAFYEAPHRIAEILPRFYTKSTDVIRSAFEDIGPWVSYEVMNKIEGAVPQENVALAIAGCAYPEASRKDLQRILQKLWLRDQELSSDRFIFTSHGGEIFRFFAQERFRDQCLGEGEALSWNALRPSLNQGTVQVLFNKEHLVSTFFPEWTGGRDKLPVSRENLAYARTAEKIMEVLDGEIKAGCASSEDMAEQAAALSLSLILVHHIFPEYGKFHVAEIPSRLSMKDFFDFKIGDALGVREMWQEEGNIQMANELESVEVLLGSMKEKLPVIEKAPWLSNPYSYFMVHQKNQGIKKVRDVLGVNASSSFPGNSPGSAPV